MNEMFNERYIYQYWLWLIQVSVSCFRNKLRKICDKELTETTFFYAISF